MSARVRGPASERTRHIGLRLLPGCLPTLRDILQKNRILVQVIKDLQKADMFLDASKDPVRLHHLLAAGHWNIKVIHLVRDGRATVNSYLKRHETSLHGAALEWRRTQEECERITARLPAEALIRVHHETLCKDPDGTLAILFRFLRLDPARARRDFRSVEHHILGNVMRLNSSSEIALDERWKTVMTPADLAVFDRVAGERNRRYGYE